MILTIFPMIYAHVGVQMKVLLHVTQLVSTKHRNHYIPPFTPARHVELNQVEQNENQTQVTEKLNFPIG